MTKEEYLEQIKQSLSGVSANDLNYYLSYYGSLVDNYLSNGYSVEHAISNIGTVDKISKDVLGNVSFRSLIGNRINKAKTSNIVLFVLFSPIIIPLLLSFIIIFDVLYLASLILVLAIYIVGFTFVGVSVASIIVGIWYITEGNYLYMLLCIGILLTALALAIMIFICSLNLYRGFRYIRRSTKYNIKKIIATKGGK